MRFLHAADLHLDSPLHAQALRQPELAERLRAASRRVLERIVEIAIAREVDALLLAGDIFDSDVADVTSRGALTTGLVRLARAGIPTVMIRGNHDALLALDRYGPVADDVFLLNRDRPTVRIGAASIHGLGFPGRDTDQSLLPHYPAPEPGRINIGLMHTSLGGTPGHDRYAPCAEADLLNHGFDYWALGHIHKRFERRGDRALAVMPGIPQGRSIRETGGDSVTLVEIDGDGARTEEIPVALLRFAHQTADLSGADTQSARMSRMEQALRDMTHPDHVTIVRLALGHAQGLRRDPALARALAVDAAETVHDVYIEAVRFAADGPAPDTGALADIAALMREDAQGPGFRDAADALLDEWRRALPRDIADVLAPENAETLIEEGISQVVARLGAGNDDP